MLKRLFQGILTIYAVLLSSSLVRPQIYSAAYSSSYSVPGRPPVAYTSSTGDGLAAAVAGSYQHNGVYLQQGSANRGRRDVHRNDATQQRVQGAPPVGFLGEHLTSSSFTVSDKLGASAFAAAQPSPPKATTTFTQSQASASAGSFQGGSRFESAPASLYGPPVKGHKHFAGSVAQAQALANQGEKAPAPVYGLPVAESGSFANAAASASLVPQTPQKAYGVPYSGSHLNTQFSPSPESDREFVFVPAFTGQIKPGQGVALAPPSGGFIPPDGALLSAPAPVINNVPLPSPRYPYNV